MFIFYISATFFYRALRISQMSLLIPGNCASTTFFSVWIEVWRFVLLYFICWIDVPCEIGVKETHARIEQTGNSIFFQKFYFIDAVVVVDNFDNLIARQIFQQEIDKNSSNEVPPSIPFYFYLYLPTFISTSLDLFINLPTISTSIPISTYVYIYLPTNLPGTSIYLSTYL